MNECEEVIKAECAGRFSVLETALKAISENTEKMATTLERLLDKHDARLASLEKWQNWLLGAGAAMGAGISFLFGWAKH